MKSHSIYKFLNKSVDYITKQDINGTLKMVLSLEDLSRKDLSGYQQASFKKLIEIAKKTSFYSNIDSENLEDFPIVSKEDFKKKTKDFITQIKPFAVDCTSGTTGSPFHFLISREMRLMKRVSHQKLLNWFGLSREEREIKLGGGFPSTITKLYHFLRNKRHIASNQLQNDPIKIIQFYNKYKAGVLYGYPSAINDFIFSSNKLGIELISPKLIVTHAENLTNEIVNCIKNKFPGVPIADQYWSTEANIATTCPKGKLHVDEDTIICELKNIDEFGFGDLLITNLYSYSFPIIRYNIGDRVKFSDEECECGRKSKIIEKVKGRDHMIIKLNNGFEIRMGDIPNLEKILPDFYRYQILYDTKSNQLALLYKSETQLLNETKKIIETFFSKQFDMNINIEENEDFIWEQSGKLKVLKQI